MAVLDAEAPGFGASTRNGGMMGSGHRVSFAELERGYGAETAEAVLREGLAALEFASSLVEREGVDGRFTRCGCFRGAWCKADFTAMAREIVFLQRKIGLEAEMVPKDEVAHQVATDRYEGGCVFLNHSAVHPALFHRGIMARAEEAGAQIIGFTPVVTLTREGESFTLRTKRGTLDARDVIVATNGYTTGAMHWFYRRLAPIASYMVATEPLGRDRVAELIPSGRMIVETRARHCYYRPSHDGERVLLGGRAALRHIDCARSAPILKRLLDGLFPSLAGVRVIHSWLGTVAFSTDHMPHIGVHDGIHYALGYSGSGVAMAPHLGWRVANKVLGNSEGDTPLDRLPLEPIRCRWAKPFGLPFVELWYSWTYFRDGS